MYKVYDDILTTEEQDDFLKLVRGYGFPYYFINSEDQTSVSQSNNVKFADKNTREAKVMVHMFMDNSERISSAFDKIDFIINKFVEKTGENITGMFRCKLNLQYQVADYNKNNYQTPHKDQEFDHKVVIYYPFTSDGDTFIFNETGSKNYEVVDRIKPIGGRFLIMNNMFHAGQPPITSETRMSLNYNLN